MASAAGPCWVGAAPGSSLGMPVPRWGPQSRSGCCAQAPELGRAPGPCLWLLASCSGSGQDLLSQAGMPAQILPLPAPLNVRHSPQTMGEEEFPGIPACCSCLALHNGRWGMLDPACCRGEAVLGRAPCALTEAGRRCSGWCRGCGEPGALGGRWGAGTPLPTTPAAPRPRPMRPPRAKAQLGPATSPAGPHPSQPPSPPSAAATCYGPGPIYQNSGENSPRLAGALIWGQCFPWDKITLTHRPPSDGVLFSSLLPANIAGGRLSASRSGVSGTGLRTPPGTR